ncbi:hypothetical protein J1C56_08990 [Aminobacter anthyllidis]|uniref:Uncharacterized protein n=1 Tax=Aminobacter anthyllidis TaxID=1035067 RepID=A0A9X1A9U8_9HYPH|nr:hypothetical protein [Aminobacter anthyllidis]MBT1155726.1 hypothetical protein [Aminobacter anthyllidis]
MDQFAWECVTKRPALVSGVSGGVGLAGVMWNDQFADIAHLIESAGSPFPTSRIRRLVLRATAKFDATDEISQLIDRLNFTLDILAIVLAELGDGPAFNRLNALDDLRKLEAACERQRRSVAQ